VGEFYDKEKFTGGRNPNGSANSGGTPPPRRPYQAPQSSPKSKNSSGWYSWPIIIILFALNIWPVALVLLFLNLFGDNSKNKKTTVYSQRGASYDAQAESAVERAMRKAGNKVEKAETKVEKAFDVAGESVDEAIGRAMEQMERTLDRTAREVHRTNRQSRTAPQPKTKAAKQKKEKIKPAGVLLRILGGVFLVGGACAGMDFLADLMGGYYTDFEDLLASLAFMVSGGVMFFRGHYLNKMSRRSQRYILAIGNVDAMPLDEIAKRVNRKPDQAAKELQKLIDKGYLGEDAYIDYERGYFLRFGATLEEDDEPAREAPPQPTPEEAKEGYSGILRNIRHANDRIADPVLTQKISRLEQVSALIFKEVEEHPEKRNSIHTFFDYYLPTTQKLLDTYAEFEETGVEGENLREAKERIEQTMDLIVAGFEHQLDQLYSSDAMDVATDIRVMEAMLKRDTASAAKDFGYDKDNAQTSQNNHNQQGQAM